MYGGVRGRKTKVGRKLLRFPPTRFFFFSENSQISCSLYNKTKIKYDIAELRIKLADKKETKATNSQTIELSPVYSLNSAKSFKKAYRNVIVVNKLTFPNEKVLRLEISENQISGRVVYIPIEYEDILNADSFDENLLKHMPYNIRK